MYESDATSASLNALGQLAVPLQEHRQHVVLVGGWAPYFILKEQSFEHGGSRDIDLALNKEVLGEARCTSIRDKIVGLGYTSAGAQFFKPMRASSKYGGNLKQVHIDMLCHKEGGVGELCRITNSIYGWGVDGLSIAFDFNCEQLIEFEIDGTSKQTTFRVVDLVGLLALKGNSFGSRRGDSELVEDKNNKDAFDMFAVTHHDGGARQAAEYVNQALDTKETSQENQELIIQSLANVKRLFKDEDQEGPIHASNYESKYSKEIIVGQMRLFFDKIERELPD